MGAYPGNGLAKLIGSNRQKYLFENDNVVVGESSVAYQIERIPGMSYPWGMSFDIAFSGAPGTFEIDIQTADIDQDSHYVTLNSLTTGSLNTSNVGRVELPNFWAKYVRVKVVSFANYETVNLKVLLTR
jgi:hypothetical protein